MPVDHHTRGELHRELAALMTPHLADAMMELMAPDPPYATEESLTETRRALQNDTERLRTEVRGEMSELRAEMSALRTEVSELRTSVTANGRHLVELQTSLRGEIAELRVSTTQQMVDLRDSLGHQMGDVQKQMNELALQVGDRSLSLGRWVIASQAATAATIASAITLFG